MNTKIIIKNKNILGAIILIMGLILVYRFSGVNLKAANSYSCNYYVGRCFVDNKFGKSNNKDSCDNDCLSKRYKYYFNKTANECVLDFRGTYNTKKECKEASLKSFQYRCDEKVGTCVAVSSNSSISYLYGGLDYDTCYKSCRPLFRAYECDKVNQKCNWVGKKGESAYFTYENCWTSCLDKTITGLPNETLYECSKTGSCLPNPSGSFKSYEECYNSSSCKLIRNDYEAKTSMRYRWDETLKKCVLDKNGLFESFGECRAVKEGVGSEFVYTCENKKCQEKKYTDFWVYDLEPSSGGCYSADCMNNAGGTRGGYNPPDMSCDVNDKCVIPSYTGKGDTTIFMTQNACQKECEKTTSSNQTTGDGLCIVNYLREVNDQSCNTSSDCRLSDDYCVNKSNKTYTGTDGYYKVLQNLCTKNKLPYADYGDKCECYNKRCIPTNSNKQIMICGDGLCNGVENKVLLYKWMTLSPTGEYKLVQPEENKYYCKQDCK